MSSSWEVQGLSKPSEEWTRMKEILDSCSKSQTPVPKEVKDFFNELGFGPDENDKLASISLEEWHGVISCTAYGVDGIEIDLSKLPKGTEKIRVFLWSWFWVLSPALTPIFILFLI